VHPARRHTLLALKHSALLHCLEPQACLKQLATCHLLWFSHHVNQARQIEVASETTTAEWLTKLAVALLQIHLLFHSYLGHI
jgi:hypothetical protein